MLLILPAAGQLAAQEAGTKILQRCVAVLEQVVSRDVSDLRAQVRVFARQAAC